MPTTKTKSTRSKRIGGTVSSSAVSVSGLYSAFDIQKLEHSGMFHSPLQQVVYDSLIHHLYKEKVNISAGSNVEALNMVKEAAVVLTSQGYLNGMFAKWLSSCYDAFTDHFHSHLVRNRA